MGGEGGGGGGGGGGVERERQRERRKITCKENLVLKSRRVCIGARRAGKGDAVCRL